MKNILIITNYPYQTVQGGGVENYNRLIYENFKELNFIEFSMLSCEENTIYNYNNVKAINFSKKKKKKKIYKFLKKLIIKNNISKIIFSGDYFFYKPFIEEYKNIIYFIQHTHPLHYFPFFKYSNDELKYKRIENTMHLDANDFFKYVKNVIVFTEFDQILIEKEYKDITFYRIAPPSKYIFENGVKEYDFITIARQEKLNKEIYFDIVKNFSNKKFLLIGNYDINEISKYKNISLLKNMDNFSLKNVFINSKFLLQSTYIEGFPFVASESLSLGIPIILWDLYPSSKFLIKNNNGILISKNDNYNKKIEKLLKLNYDILLKKCLLFSEKYLTINSFINSWKKIFYSH